MTLIQATPGVDGNADDGCQIDLTDDLHQTSKDKKKDGLWVESANRECCSKGFGALVVEMISARLFSERSLFVERMFEKPKA